MASTTGIPQHTPDSRDADPSEPLLGQPGDASQRSNDPIIKNLYIGTGIISEGGAVLLLASVWAAIFLHTPLSLFSVHPLAQSFGVLVLVQAILILQPTASGPQKRTGQKIHAGLNLLALASFIVGVASIETNKIRSGMPHFHSVHAYLGIISSIWHVLQYLVGFTMYATPQLYGGEVNAKKIWKYHRASGYALLLLYLATVISATQTTYNLNVLGLKLWAMIVISVLIVIGVYPRIKKQKLGL